MAPVLLSEDEHESGSDSDDSEWAMSGQLHRGPELPCRGYRAVSTTAPYTCSSRMLLSIEHLYLKLTHRPLITTPLNISNWGSMVDGGSWAVLYLQCRHLDVGHAHRHAYGHALQFPLSFQADEILCVCVRML